MSQVVEIHTEDESDPEYEEGLDEEYETDDDEYREDLDLEDDEDGESEEEGQANAAAEYIRGLGQLPRRPQGSGREIESKDGIRPWQGLSRLPEATRNKYVDLLKRLKNLEKKELTILLIGKHFTGKSHTVNSLLNEEAAKKQYLNRDQTPTTVHSREAHGLKLNLIDTGGPTELDFFSVARMTEMAKEIEGRQVDAVLYVDRFDNFRTDGSDQQVIEGLTKYLGPSIWDNTIICLTRAAGSVNGFSFDEFAEKRSSKVRSAIRKYGRNQSASLPAALIENSESCEQNSEGERVLPNKQAWLPELMSQIVNIAETTKPYKYNKSAIDRISNPNKKLRWAVPLIFIAQLALKKFVLDPILKDDYNTGDKNGPFEPHIVKGRRAVANLEKQGKVRKGAAKRQTSRSRQMQLYDSDSD